MIYKIMKLYIKGRDLSIPAYFIPAHVDGAWSKILGCCRRCCCSAEPWTVPPPLGIIQIIKNINI